MKQLLARPCSSLLNTPLNLPPVSPDYLDISFTGRIAQPVNEIQNGNSFPFAASSVFYASVKSCNRLTIGDDVKYIVSLSLNIEGCGWDFLPGDTIGIIPCNHEEEVDQVLKSTDMLDKADHEFSLVVLEDTAKKKACVPPYIPSNSSARQVLKTCVDIRSIPKKALLHMLAEYTFNPEERIRLHQLCSREGTSEYKQHILESNTTLLDVLQTFSSCRPPLVRLLEHLPRLQSRPYSVACSPLSRPDIVEVVFSVVESPRLGLCSGWLERMLCPNLSDSLNKQLERLSLDRMVNDIKIPVFLRKSSGFRIPNDPSVPLILIGPGTGVAPFIGFLEHRAKQKSLTSADDFGDIWLYFGCRYSDRDFIYRSAIEEYLKNGTLSRLYTAFSREQTSKSNAKYVQDNISQCRKEFVKQLLKDNATVFVCGDAKNMAKDVLDTIASAISSEQGVTENEAHGILTNLQSTGKYLQEIWT